MILVFTPSRNRTVILRNLLKKWFKHNWIVFSFLQNILYTFVNELDVGGGKRGHQKQRNHFSSYYDVKIIECPSTNSSWTIRCFQCLDFVTWPSDFWRPVLTAETFQKTVASVSRPICFLFPKSMMSERCLVFRVISQSRLGCGWMKEKNQHFYEKAADY